VAEYVDLLEAPQDLFISRGRAIQVGMEQELDLGRRFKAWRINLYETIEARISHAGQAPSASFLAGRIGILSGQESEKCPLPNLRKTYKTEFHCLPLLPFNKITSFFPGTKHCPGKTSHASLT
jgi:hypothetical protein